MKKSRKLIIILLIIVTTVSVLYIIDLGKPDFTKFDSEVWNEYVLERENMVEDFERQYDLKNMTKEDVKDLLGWAPLRESDRNLVYYVGRSRYYHIFYNSKGNFDGTYLDYSG